MAFAISDYKENLGSVVLKTDRACFRTLTCAVISPRGNGNAIPYI